MKEYESSPPNSLARRVLRGMRRWFWRSLLVLCLIYVVLAARFYFTGHVNVARNISHEFNEPVLKIPESERAWTHYRKASLDLEPLPEDFFDSWEAPLPGDACWTYLERNASILERVRQASTLPVLGAVYSVTRDQGIDAGDAAIPAPGMPDGNPYPFNLLMPSLGKGRLFARLLTADAMAAAHAGDGAKAVRDIVAMLHMARQFSACRTGLEQRTGMAICRLACETFFAIVCSYPDLLTDEQAAKISHSLEEAALTVSTLRFDLDRALVDDYVQRIYTDDGNGNGFFNFQGCKNNIAFCEALKRESPAGPRARDYLFGPLSFGLPSRKELQSFAEATFETLEEAARTFRSERSADLRNQIVNIELPPAHSPVYGIALLFAGSAAQHIDALDMIRQDIDSTRVVIAVTRHRARHQRYPATLDELEADLRGPPTRDMATGESLRYILRDGWPMVYSVGGNRKDDGGSLPPLPFAPDNAASEGDWILFPPIKSRAGYITSPGPWPADRMAPAESPSP